MPYNLTQATVDRWAETLDALFIHDDDGKPVEPKHEEVKIETNDPIALSYSLREAIRAASAIGAMPYELLEGKFRFRTGPGHVLAEPKQPLLARVVSTPTLGQRRETRYTFESAESEFDVVAAAQSSSLLTELLFPNFKGKLAPVRAWAAANGFDVLSDPILQLKRKEPCEDS